MGIIYIFAVTAFFGLIAIAWALYEGYKLDHSTE